MKLYINGFQACLKDLFSLSLYPIDDAWVTFKNKIIESIASRQSGSVLEIGGGANPFLTKEQVVDYKLDYTVVDISEEEIEKNATRYFQNEVCDLSIKPLDRKFDLIFSKMVLEHISKPDQLHKNIYGMLNEGGRVIHFYATMYGLPSMLNLVLPDTLSDFIVYKLQGRDSHDNGKFEAYYNQCFGPTELAKKRYRTYGYEIEEFNGFLGHDYLKKIYFLSTMERMWNYLILKINSPYFCSNAIVILKS